MSVELVDRKTGELVATCDDLAWAMKHMQFWGLTLKHVAVRFAK